MRVPLRSVFIALCFTMALFILQPTASAQETAPAAPPAAAPAPAPAVVPVAATTAAPPSERVVLKEGTEVPLVFSADLNSKTAVDDDTVNMTLADDLKVGDVVVLRKGAPARCHRHKRAQGWHDGQTRRAEHSPRVCEIG